MRVFLVHVRDPQFYAIPAKRRSRNGRVRVMGFPPIGIMALSAVLKRAGHEVVLFDQADPATPTAVIIEELRRQRPVLVGLSFLSTTSYPYAKLLARQLRAADARVKMTQLADEALARTLRSSAAERVRLDAEESAATAM